LTDLADRAVFWLGLGEGLKHSKQLRRFRVLVQSFDGMLGQNRNGVVHASECGKSAMFLLFRIITMLLCGTPGLIVLWVG